MVKLQADVLTNYRKSESRESVFFFFFLFFCRNTQEPRPRFSQLSRAGLPGEMRDTEKEGKNNEAGRGDKIQCDELGKRRKRKKRTKRILTHLGTNVNNNLQHIIFQRVTIYIFTYV